jgi:hypothetical protein
MTLTPDPEKSCKTALKLWSRGLDNMRGGFVSLCPDETTGGGAGANPWGHSKSKGRAVDSRRARSPRY